MLSQVEALLGQTVARLQADLSMYLTDLTDAVEAEALSLVLPPGNSTVASFQARLAAARV